MDGYSPSEERKARAIAERLIKAGGTQREFFAAARAKGLGRREADIMRPLWNEAKTKALRSSIRREGFAKGLSSRVIARNIEEAIAAERAKSIRLNRGQRVIPRVREVVLPRERYQYGGDLDFAGGSLKVRGQDRQKFHVTFGSDKPLTKGQITNRIRGEWKRMRDRFQKAYGVVQVGAIRITRADEVAKVDRKRKNKAKTKAKTKRRTTRRSKKA